MPSQANSVGHDRVLGSTADGVACSRDALLTAAVTGSRPVNCAVPQPRKNRRLNLRRFKLDFRGGYRQWRIGAVEPAAAGQHKRPGLGGRFHRRQLGVGLGADSVDSRHVRQQQRCADCGRFPASAKEPSYTLDILIAYYLTSREGVSDHLGDYKRALTLCRSFMERLTSRLDNAWRLTAADISVELEKGIN
jgi:hypothetical protein